MPISATPPSAAPAPAAIEANRQGIALLATGDAQGAADAFRRGVQAQPDNAELQLNLAVALTRGQQYDLARETFARVTQLRPGDPTAYFALYELEQMAGHRDQALAYQARALRVQTVYSAYAPNQQRRILALLAPGDWQANVPLDYLVDASTTTLHKVYLTDEDSTLVPLPKADVTFCAIAQSPENVERLQWAENVAARAARPVLNAPANVAAADRQSVYERLRDVPNVRVPETRAVAREQLSDAVAYPAIVRPTDSQAGKDLAKLGDSAQLAAYLHTTRASAFYVMPFVDYSNADGYFRKYRIFVVDRQPLPCHLAISSNWMIHYYNAPMREHRWMRDEERRVLERFDEVFSPELRAAMTQIARTLDLEYLGLDCSIDRDGKVLVFEADPAMIVHAADDAAMFGYKHAAAHKIFDAFAAMVDRARSR